MGCPNPQPRRLQQLTSHRPISTRRPELRPRDPANTTGTPATGVPSDISNRTVTGDVVNVNTGSTAVSCDNSTVRFSWVAQTRNRDDSSN